MRLTLSAYVFVQQEEGRSIYVCQPLRGSQLAARDPLLGTALSKLANKMRQEINAWIKTGKASRVEPWLHDADMQSRVEKLTLTLRDRTLRWKLLMVAVPSFERYVVFSPSVPSVVFEVDSLVNLEERAGEVYTAWAQSQISSSGANLPDLEGSSDMSVEVVEVDVESAVRIKKKSSNMLAALFGGEKMVGSEELHKVGQCLDDRAADFESALGREELVDEVDRLLARDDRQGVILVGPPACGKSAIVQDCVTRRAERFRKRRGQKPQIWWLSPQRLISGMSYLGQWEQRWLAILREASKRDHVLYFDDLVGLFTAGRTRDSSLSAADVLRSYLGENQVRILAETTAEQLAILRRRDRALADRFHLVYVPELSPRDSLPIVLESAYRIESQQNRFFHPAIISLVMEHQEIFATDRAFPGKAIEMNKVLAKHAESAVNRPLFYRQAATQVGASLMLLLGHMGDQDSIRFSLNEQLVGQPAATEALSKIVVRFAQHLQPPDRPLGVLLMLGPTGVGKTEAAKALTRLLYQSESHLVRLDMNELTTPYAAEQLIGTFDQPEGRLTSAVRRQPNCVILLDEIEKAHPDVFDYLLQVLGEGRLTDARGRIADFRSAIIIMTSNLGAAQQNASLGFDVTAERREQIYVKAAKTFFRPEFFNRIDNVVAFRSLDATDMEKIVTIQLRDVLSRDGLQRRNVYVNVSKSAIERVIATGFDSRLGARAVRRMLEREVIGPLGDCLAGMNTDAPALIRITHTPPANELNCRVLDLEIQATTERSCIDDLGKLFEVAAPLARNMAEQLSSFEAELNQRDQAAGETKYKASYYALREQVYRCSELLKAAELVLQRKREPKLSFNASPSVLTRRDWDDSGSRRIVKDYLSQQDLRDAIRDGNLIDNMDAVSDEQLTREIVDNFSSANAMIETALEHRTWLIGFQSLTDNEPSHRRSSEFGDDGPGFEIFDTADGHHELLLRLINCLRYRWHYDVVVTDVPGPYWLVSGVSVLGTLKPLLGTYRVQSRQQSTSLCVLRAVPVALGASEPEMLSALEASPIIDASGALQTPPHQPFPTHVIRGEITELVKDFVSGAETPLASSDWFMAEKLIDRQMSWWMQLLPPPSSFVLPPEVHRPSEA